MQYSRAKRYSKGSSNRIKKIVSVDGLLKAVLFLLIFYAGLSLLFGDKNVFNYIKKLRYERELISEIEKLKSENLALIEKKRYLEKDIFYIEKRAREDLGLKRENEDIFVIVEKKGEGNNIVDKTNRWLSRILEAYKDK